MIGYRYTGKPDQPKEGGLMIYGDSDYLIVL